MTPKPSPFPASARTTGAKFISPLNTSRAEQGFLKVTQVFQPSSCLSGIFSPQITGRVSQALCLHFHTVLEITAMPSGWKTPYETECKGQQGMPRVWKISFILGLGFYAKVSPGNHSLKQSWAAAEGFLEGRKLSRQQKLHRTSKIGGVITKETSFELLRGLYPRLSGVSAVGKSPKLERCVQGREIPWDLGYLPSWACLCGTALWGKILWLWGNPG